MFTYSNPDDLDAAVPTPFLIRQWEEARAKEAESRRLFPDCTAYRDRYSASKRRKQVVSAALWVFLFLIIAAAHYYDPCRPDAAHSCSEVSR